MTSCPEAMGWGFGNLKKTVSWNLSLDEASRFSELAEARPVVCGAVSHVVGSDGKVRIERNCVSLSVLMSKNLKLKKVNKSFVLEQKKKRAVSVSRVFGFLYAYEHYERFMHVNILVVFLDMNILQFWHKPRFTRMLRDSVI